MLNPHQKASLLRALEIAMIATEELPTTTPCSACSWNQSGYCAKWKDWIPPDAIEAGCNEFQFNPESVPF